jgi:hypothetical protein
MCELPFIIVNVRCRRQSHPQPQAYYLQHEEILCYISIAKLTRALMVFSNLI